MVEYQKVEVAATGAEDPSVPYQKVQVVNADWVPSTGGTFTGAITIDVSADVHIILKRDSLQDYINQLPTGSFPDGHCVFDVDIDGNIRVVGNVDGYDISSEFPKKLNKAGDTMTGNLTMSSAFILLGYANGIYINDCYFGAAATGKFSVWDADLNVIFQIDASGNIVTVGTVDGVDISVHAATALAHHDHITTGQVSHAYLTGVTESQHHTYPVPTAGIADGAVTGAKIGFEEIDPLKSIDDIADSSTPTAGGTWDTTPGSLDNTKDKDLTTKSTTGTTTQTAADQSYFQWELPGVFAVLMIWIKYECWSDAGSTVVMLEGSPNGVNWTNLVKRLVDVTTPSIEYISYPAIANVGYIRLSVYHEAPGTTANIRVYEIVTPFATLYTAP